MSNAQTAAEEDDQARPSEVRVALRGVTKRFGDLLANRNVTIEGVAGEVHAVLGENGAGKTTAMRLLAGLLAPDEGHVEIAGSARHLSPKVAKSLGIAMVHQHFSLVNALTVAENLALGAPGLGFIFRPGEWRRHLAATAERTGFDIRFDTPVSHLSMGERQRVEIFRTLLQGANILILDEPTSILAPQEAAHLFDHVSRLADRGCVIFLVTHKLEHARAVADRVTVMRRGAVVETAHTNTLSDAQLLELVVGRPVQSAVRTRRPACRDSARPVLTLKDVSSRRGIGTRELRRVSLEVFAGEIVGVAGFAGNGQEQLVDVVTGAARCNGTVAVSAESRQGIALVPGDRMRLGIAPSLPLGDNLNLRSFHRRENLRGPFLRRAALAEQANAMVKAYDIRPADLAAPAGTLSGGNVQKIILARELRDTPVLLVAVSPTAGLDVATVEFVHSQIVALAEQGVGVLLISEDLEELVALSDRIVVLFEGRIVDELVRAEFDSWRIGRAMVGFGNGGRVVAAKGASRSA